MTDNRIRKNRKLPVSWEKLFDNGSASYCIENKINGTNEEMLEHLVELLNIDDGCWEIQLNKLILSHPDYLEILNIHSMPGEKEDSTTYYYIVNLC